MSKQTKNMMMKKCGQQVERLGSVVNICCPAVDWATLQDELWRPLLTLKIVKQWKING